MKLTKTAKEIMALTKKPTVGFIQRKLRLRREMAQRVLETIHDIKGSKESDEPS